MVFLTDLCLSSSINCSLLVDFFWLETKSRINLLSSFLFVWVSIEKKIIRNALIDQNKINDKDIAYFKNFYYKFSDSCTTSFKAFCKKYNHHKLNTPKGQDSNSATGLAASAMAAAAFVATLYWETGWARKSTRNEKK